LEFILLETVVLARQAICEEADKKIVAGDVILTYGFSALILETLQKSFKDKKNFRVVVLDSSPRFEGLEMLRRLTKAQIPCGYMLISGASYIMSEVRLIEKVKKQLIILFLSFRSPKCFWELMLCW
jgi:translation initiation factor eIF-2B subunit delta